MSEDRDRSLLWLVGLVLFAVVFGVLSYGSTQWFASPHPGADAREAQGLLANIAASFAFAAILDGVYVFRQSWLRRSFKTFFGDLAEADKTIFVYPDFTFTEAATAALKALPEKTKIYRRDSSRHFPADRVIDVPYTVASNDLQAIVFLLTNLGPLFGARPRLLTDGPALDDQERSMISIGLTSNTVTDLYLDSDLDPLFALDTTGRTPSIKLLKKDSNEEGKTYPKKDDSYEHGLILRYRPFPNAHPRMYWFICAGLGAAGTPAAAWALAHNWKSYRKRFGVRDFALVFKTTENVASYTNFEEVDFYVRPVPPRAPQWWARVVLRSS